MAKPQVNLYFSARHITAVRGRFNKKENKAEILQKVVEPIPENAILNGLIMDEDAVIIALQKVSDAMGGLGNAELVVDTTHMIYKLTVLPKTSHKETATLVKNEFLGRDMANKEYIYDYSVLATRKLTKKRRFVMCCAIDKAIIDSYKATFAKIPAAKLVKVDFAQNALLQALSIGADVLDENKLICVVDHYVVSIINILSNGEVYFHRARILSNERDENYFDEISDVIYSYVQGRKSVNRDEAFDKIVLLDGNVYAPERYAGRLERFRNVGMGIESLMDVGGTSAEESDQFVFNICLLNPRPVKTLNLLNYKTKRKVNPALVKGIAIGAVVAAIIGAEGAYLYLTFNDIMRMEGEAARIGEYLASPEVRNAEAEYQRLILESAELSSVAARLTEYSDLVGATPILTRNTAIKTLGKMDADVLCYGISFTEENGVAAFYFLTTDPERVHANVNKIRAARIYNGLTYEGYGFSDDVYDFTVFGGVKEGKAVE